MNILSLGAGVQSSTLALMAAQGEIGPMPDAAIFADTGWEPRAVHDYLGWLEKQLPFPVYRVMHKDGIRHDAGLRGMAQIPYFTANGGMTFRQCTRDYKIDPIRRKVRELLGYQPRQRIPDNSVTQWIGISTDEAVRVKPSRDNWIDHRWPLIELRMSRSDCLAWFGKREYPQPPKSSCLGCPYHSDAQWLHIKNSDPEGWKDVVDMDRVIREAVSGMREKLYMHRSLKPIDEVVFFGESNLDMFGNECEGMCGL